MATRTRRPQAKACPCCGDKIDLNDECACFCAPDPKLPSCNRLPECHYAAATRVMILGQWYTKEADSWEPPDFCNDTDCECECPVCLAAKTAPPLSPTLEAELAELVAERDLEAEPFPRG